ncbi:MAG TPA: hypothetical protein DCW68_04195 [Rhodospirillaceae bacterium]|nr:MAG: hypothetical protein A2018_07380 [Alphaproteobacteria bacterium GWF2_58_20]HAU29296.1 hypothetical protein [Rhodospirillaceae bacterium]
MIFSLAHPWLLAALIPLPLLWWILRITPPAPKHIRFPAIRLLMELPQPSPSPRQTPLWLLLLRMAFLALVILGLAGPVMVPAPQRDTLSKTCLAIIDNGWASASSWPLMRQSLATHLTSCSQTRLLPMARQNDGSAASLTPPMATRQALAAFDALAPRPWPADDAATLETLEDFPFSPPLHILWLASGISGPGTAELAKKLATLGQGDILLPDDDHQPHLILPPRRTPEGLSIPILRTSTKTAGDGFLHIFYGKAPRRSLPFHFPAGENLTETRLSISPGHAEPPTRLEIAGEVGAGTTFLADSRLRSINIGLADSGGTESQPYLMDTLYIDRALSPFYPLQRGAITTLVSGKATIIFLPDSHALAETDVKALESFVQAGGTLVRLAGQNLATMPEAPLLPTPLRGERRMDGAMGWGSPQPLAPFPEGGLFHGINPPAEATVSRQLLAEPATDLEKRTWASLADGTPLITGARHGAGWLVLIHTNANPEWSNLALSGVFETLLRRLAETGDAMGDASFQETQMEPVLVMDGFGTLMSPAPTHRGIMDTAAWIPNPAQPPGLYGQTSRGMNLGSAIHALLPFPEPPPGLALQPYDTAGQAEIPLAALLLGAALLLLAIDTLASLHLRGILLAIALFMPVMTGMAPAMAEDPALNLHLAYIKTGQAETDATSKAGLEGLARFLSQRTSLAELEVSGVDPDRDPLAFYPLLYWPVNAGPSPLNDAAAAALASYMQDGGLLLVDTKGEPASQKGRLQETAKRIGIPPLVPVPADHVLRRSFYLLEDFPGRFTGQPVFIAPPETGGGDGISPIIAGENDWAGAWAATPAGRPLLPVIPGGERQREMAFRFGTNLVMMALTGNYKADQVHLPAITERLRSRGKQ